MGRGCSWGGGTRTVGHATNAGGALVQGQPPQLRAHGRECHGPQAPRVRQRHAVFDARCEAVLQLLLTSVVGPAGTASGEGAASGMGRRAILWGHRAARWPPAATLRSLRRGPCRHCHAGSGPGGWHSPPRRQGGGTRSADGACGFACVDAWSPGPGRATAGDAATSRPPGRLATSQPPPASEQGKQAGEARRRTAELAGAAMARAVVRAWPPIDNNCRRPGTRRGPAPGQADGVYGTICSVDQLRQLGSGQAALSVKDGTVLPLARLAHRRPQQLGGGHEHTFLLDVQPGQEQGHETFVRQNFVDHRHRGGRSCGT